MAEEYTGKTFSLSVWIARGSRSVPDRTTEALMKSLLSPRDLAQAIGVSESSIKRWVKLASEWRTGFLENNRAV